MVVSYELLNGVNALAVSSRIYKSDIYLMITSGPTLQIMAYKMIFDGKTFEKRAIFSDYPTKMKSVATLVMNTVSKQFYVFGTYLQDVYIYFNDGMKNSVVQCNDLGIALTDIVDGLVVRQEQDKGEMLLVADTGKFHRIV